MAEMTTFGVKMLDEQKEDLQKRISASGVTAAEYLAMVTTSYDAQQHRETMIDDREVKILDQHLFRISEIYLSMAKNRADEKVIAQESKAELEEHIKNLKTELFDLRKTTETQLAELRSSTDAEIEAADQRVSLAEQKESQAIDDKLKAESNELQTQRAYSKLEEYNTDLKTKISEGKQEIADANQRATAANEQVKEMRDILSIEESKASTAQAKSEALTAELQRISQELTLVKQDNKGLLDKLDTERELKNVALGELKAVHENHKESQGTIAEQRKTIDELNRQLWIYKNKEKITDEVPMS